MLLGSSGPETSSSSALLASMRKRLEVEAYFAASGRTFRKDKHRLWFNESVKPLLLKKVFQACGLWKRGLRNALTPVSKTLHLTFATLPVAFDGFTILQISDLHIDKVDGLVEALLPLVQEASADLCVLTGDYRFEIRGPCKNVYPRMHCLLKAVQAREGIYGILGNHDAAEIALDLDRQNVKMLMNRAVPLERGGARIWLAGIDDPYDYRCDDLEAALRDIPAGEFIALLAHTPSLYREAEVHGVQLYLCGHTHAGQIRLPVLGAVKKNGLFPRRYTQGAWTYGRMHGYTSWGAGCSTLPVRFNCPPEITLITLHRP